MPKRASALLAVACLLDPFLIGGPASAQAFARVSVRARALSAPPSALPRAREARVRLFERPTPGARELVVELTHLNGAELRKKESFAVEVPKTGRPELFQALFAHFGSMFLVAPHMPARLKVDFPVSPEIAEFIGAMYDSSGLKRPAIDAPGAVRLADSAPPALSRGRSVVAYSGGKDSVYNYIREVEAKGRGNVEVLHYALLNPVVGAAELKATKRQIEAFPIPRARILRVRNGTRNRGHAIIQAREFLMLALAVPAALDFRASEVLTEGAYDEDSPYFGGKRSGFVKFNRLLEALRIPVAARWIEAPQLEVLRFVLARKPAWLKLVRNCFSPDVWAGGYRRAWRRHAPRLARILLHATDGNCGSCLKCRVTNLAVLLENPRLLREIPKRELAYFTGKMRKWAEEHREQHKDFIDAHFWQGLERLERTLKAD